MLAVAVVGTATTSAGVLGTALDDPEDDHKEDHAVSSGSVFSFSCMN